MDGADPDAVVGGALFLNDEVGLVADIVLNFVAFAVGEQTEQAFATEISAGPNREFAVAVFADLVGVDGFGVDGEIFGDFEAEPGGV